MIIITWQRAKRLQQDLHTKIPAQFLHKAGIFQINLVLSKT